MSSYWPEFLLKGDIIFNYMINNYNHMIKDDEISINFDIIDIRRSIPGEILLRLEYNNILKDFIPWIQNEINTENIFIKEYWKPFRDLYAMTDMVLGYKTMFQYKQYYFQLAMDSLYDIDSNIDNNNKVYFELVIYGWKDENNNKLQPDNIVSIPDNCIMPEYYWRKK